jgi:hypothetical protein
VAATRGVMEALLATCEDNLSGKRDRALLLFGWASGGSRNSEITDASFENVRRDGSGFVFELHRSKTNQSGRKGPKADRSAARQTLRPLPALRLCHRTRQAEHFTWRDHGHDRPPSA